MDPPQTPEHHRQQERDEERRQHLQMTSPTICHERSDMQNQLHDIPPPPQPFLHPPAVAGPSHDDPFLVPGHPAVMPHHGRHPPAPLPPLQPPPQNPHVPANQAVPPHLALLHLAPSCRKRGNKNITQQPLPPQPPVVAGPSHDNPLLVPGHPVVMSHHGRNPSAPLPPLQPPPQNPHAPANQAVPPPLGSAAVAAMHTQAEALQAALQPSGHIHVNANILQQPQAHTNVNIAVQPEAAILQLAPPQYHHPPSHVPPQVPNLQWYHSTTIHLAM
ncbi:hypothetical protein BU17DRAFT_95787 [Hysterangium stoloniferum]|nr:hypothetical protein BU17DRAFT_95787 [Hysterangium stoloniferum]